MFSILVFIITSSILWFLITYFIRGTENTHQKAITITLIVTVCDFVMSLTLRHMIGGFTSIVSLLILFGSIEWICDVPRKKALMITGCYFLIVLIIGLFSALLFVQVDA